MTLLAQLVEKGFDADFRPDITDGRFQDYKDDCLGKMGYSYSETPTPKGSIKRFCYIVWKSMTEHETLTELPDGLTKKDRSEADRLTKEEREAQKDLLDAKHEIAAREADALFATLVDPKIVPAYLKEKDLPFLQGYKVDPLSPYVMYIPLYGASGKIESYQKICIDGSKDFPVGGKIKGTYALLEAEGDTLYICEGFSTAVSIHLATGQSVAMVTSSYNYEFAIPTILHRIKRDFVVVCADDDVHLKENMGLIKATKSAKRFNLILKNPKFKTLSGKSTTDFDDLRRLESLEEVSKQLLLSDKEKLDMTMAPGITCLGHRGGAYCLSSTENQTVQTFPALNKDSLFKLMNLEYWKSRYGVLSQTGQLTLDWDKIGSDIMTECHQVGVYYGSNVRGIGCYFDEGRKVIHLGDRLLVDNKITPIRALKSKHTYVMTRGIAEISPEQLTDQEAREFAEKFNLCTLTETNARKYVKGWLVCSVLSGMLDWRPHVYISGKKGTGKTQITELVNRILSKGFLSVYTHGIQTTAVAVRQKVNSDAVPVIFDEVEGDSKKTQANASSYIALCRIASSNSEATTILGSSTQNAIEFKVSFCAWIAGIMPQLQQDSDKSRFALIETSKDRHSKEQLAKNWTELAAYWRTIDDVWARKFVSRVIHNAEIIVANINKTRAYLNKERGLDGRQADQFGTLLAAALSFKHLNPVSQDELASFYSILSSGEDLSVEASSTNDQDIDCLKHILSAKIRTPDGVETRVQRELIKPDMSDEVKNLLGEFGVVPLDQSQRFGIHIRETGEIKKHLSSLPNYEIGFLKALSRIEGAKPHRVRFQKSYFRGVWVPLDNVLSEPDDFDEVPF